MNPNSHICSEDDRESKSVHEMDISVNTSKVKATKDEELVVTDIEVIKDPGYSKLFDCGKEFINNLDVTYEQACIESVKGKDWSKFHHNITNHNDRNDIPLYNVKIREAINKVMMEEQVITESNNITVDTFMGIPQRKRGEYMIIKVTNLKINIGNNNDMIDKVIN